MTIALCIALIASVAALVLIVRNLNETHREAQAQWALERRELLTRIQRPEAPMPHLLGNYEIPEQAPDEWDLVGTVKIDPEAYLRGEGVIPPQSQSE